MSIHVGREACVTHIAVPRHASNCASHAWTDVAVAICSIQTEFGWIDVAPQEICVIQRGIR